MSVSTNLKGSAQRTAQCSTGAAILTKTRLNGPSLWRVVGFQLQRWQPFLGFGYSGVCCSQASHSRCGHKSIPLPWKQWEPRAATRRPPLLGEHTEEVLLEWQGK